MPPLNELLQLALRGDQQATGELLASYRSYLMFLARGQISQRLEAKATASDIVQETLMHAHRAFDQFAGSSEKELLGWLRQILSARLVDTLRRYTSQKRDYRLEERMHREMDDSTRRLRRGLLVDPQTPSRQAIRRESMLQLADALEKIAPDYRQVVVLHHLEGLSVDEVAQRMNRSPSGVRKLWARALVKLRQAIKELG